MRDTTAKLLPYGVGIVIGVLSVVLSNLLEVFGPAGNVVEGVLILAIIVAVTAMSFGHSIPENVELQSIPEADLPDDILDLSNHYQTLGFLQANTPQRVNMLPPAMLIPFVSGHDQTYGTIYRTGNIPAKTSHDFISIFEGDRGALTTGVARMGASLPAAAGDLKQIFPKASPAELFDHHRIAIKYLDTLGIKCKPVSAKNFISDFRAGMEKERNAFFKSPMRNAVILLWRVTTRQIPHIGPIQDQRFAAKQIQALLDE